MTTRMIHGRAEQLPLDDETVDCIVTSPPYNVGKEYAGVPDDLELVDYVILVERWAAEMHRVLKPGGRLWLNTSATTNQNGDDGRERGYRTNMVQLWMGALTGGGLLFRDLVVWNKTIGNQSTGWGSHLSPNAPNLRGRWEPILLYFKERWTRARDDGPNDIDPIEWPILVSNVWTFPPEGANRWHPAPFPAEIPRRAILLSTWPGDTVLDPFAGSGTTLDVAHRLGRVGIGVEASEYYVDRWREKGLQQPLEVVS